MKNFSRIQIAAILLLMFLILTACGITDLYWDLSGDEDATVEAQAQATLTAIAAEKSPDPTSTREAPEETQTSSGIIEGSLSYPSEYLPPQRVVAFDVTDFERYFIVEVQTGSGYKLEVPPGTYYVLSYLINPSQAGASPDWYAGYSEFVGCGLQAGCEDHNLVPVVVDPGVTISEINPIDWYLPSGEDAGWPSDPTKAETGSISGDLAYPSEYIPPQRVVAFDINSASYYYADTQRNQGAYEITDLPPGTYHVMAYVLEQGPEISAGYSYAVTCGLTVECDDHRLIDVLVYPGEVTEDVDPIDFYPQTDQVDWPENPTQ